MIAELIQAGTRLSGRHDPRLQRGLQWSVLEGLLAAAPYAVLHVLLDAVFFGTVTPALVAASGAGMLALMLVRIAVAQHSMHLIFSGCYAMMGEARLRIANHLRRLPMGWFAGQRSGDLSARLTSDLELIEHLWSHFLGIFVSSLAMPAFLLGFLVWVDWRLAMVVAMSLPAAALVLAITQHAASAPSQRMMSANAQAQAGLQEYIQGIAVIRSFGRFGQAWRRLAAILDEQHAALVAIETKPAPWLAGFGFVLEAGLVAVVLVGIWLLDRESLAPPVLLTFLVLALPIYRQAFDVGLSTLLLRFARRALVRIDALLAEPELPEPAAFATPLGHEVEFRNVHFSYGAEGPLVLDGLSCVIPAHALTAVVGPSGAGKSTLVHLVARLWDVGSGQVRIGGVDVRAIGSANLHRHVSMVFQDVVLFSGSVLDNLRIGRPDATRQQAIEAAKKARAHDFIEALPQGYDTLLEEGGASLSGGERQRISIARALLKDAPILLLDEATASVDPSSEADIQEAIAELAHGRTVVVIAHRLHSLRHADHILVLDKGRLAEQGTHADLLGLGGVYCRLWQAQQQARDWQLQTPSAENP